MVFRAAAFLPRAAASGARAFGSRAPLASGQPIRINFNTVKLLQSKHVDSSLRLAGCRYMSTEPAANSEPVTHEFQAGLHL